MLAVIGTVPDERLPVVDGNVSLKGANVLIKENKIPISRGTAALLAAAIKAKDFFGKPQIYAFLAGDTGNGKGSKALYEFLTQRLKDTDFDTIVFHYIQPDVDLHNKVLFTIQEMKKRPKLIADAGFMYVAKMSGQATEYDLFTPDIGECAFLADEKAPHPFYTRGFIIHEENKVPDLIERAYRCQNASKFLLVKGKKDYIASSKGILSIVDTPECEAMEAIGGTGDTLTGIVSVLISIGFEIDKAATIAAKVNRFAGYFARPDPATQIAEIIVHIPKALLEVLKRK